MWTGTVTKKKLCEPLQKVRELILEVDHYEKKNEF